MKRILLAILFIICLSFPAHALDPVMQQVITEGSSTAVCYEYWGWPNTAGSPNGFIGEEGDYEQTADRVYTETITATKNGTVVAINLRYGTHVTTGANGAWLVAYNAGTKIGQVVDGSPVASTWTGFQDLTVIGGQSLSFVTDAVLDFGLGFDGSGGVACGVSYDAGGAAQKMRYDDSVTVDGSGPDATCTFGDATTAHAGAIMLKVQVACP